MNKVFPLVSSDSDITLPSEVDSSSIVNPILNCEVNLNISDVDYAREDDTFVPLTTTSLQNFLGIPDGYSTSTPKWIFNFTSFISKYEVTFNIDGSLSVTLGEDAEVSTIAEEDPSDSTVSTLEEALSTLESAVEQLSDDFSTYISETDISSFSTYWGLTNDRNYESFINESNMMVDYLSFSSCYLVNSDKTGVITPITAGSFLTICIYFITEDEEIDEGHFEYFDIIIKEATYKGYNFIVEVDENRLIVYPLDDSISEFYISNCYLCNYGATV